MTIYRDQTPPAGIWYMAAWLQQCLSGRKQVPLRTEQLAAHAMAVSAGSVASDGPSGLSVSVQVGFRRQVRVMLC